MLRQVSDSEEAPDQRRGSRGGMRGAGLGLLLLLLGTGGVLNINSRTRACLYAAHASLLPGIAVAQLVSAPSGSLRPP
jgi:hypothetical protein